MKSENRGLSMFENAKQINLLLIFGCRPSTGVKANTTMVKDIFDSFIQNAERINFTVLLPDVFNFMDANDVTFEMVSSSKIKIIKLYHKHNVATTSIGLVIAHGFHIADTDALCHKMLKKCLKLDRVHTYKGLSLSQLEEKITWLIEKTTSSSLSYARLQDQLSFVVIINIGHGYFLESQKGDKADYDYCNKYYRVEPQKFPGSTDLTTHYNNFKEFCYEDRHGQYEEELVSMVDSSVRISNNSQNFILVLEVATYSSQTYGEKIGYNPKYQIPLISLNERPGL